MPAPQWYQNMLQFYYRIKEEATRQKKDYDRMREISMQNIQRELLAQKKCVLVSTPEEYFLAAQRVMEGIREEERLGLEGRV